MRIIKRRENYIVNPEPKNDAASWDKCIVTSPAQEKRIKASSFEDVCYNGQFKFYVINANMNLSSNGNKWLIWQ